ncbi:MAG TPA: serine/threonine-protein kinase [Polyangiaceae bacterium]|nr:serine/threonine-protein kinase [Polyangiaceae bacterium]
MRTVQRGEVIAGKYVVQGIIGRGGVGIIAAARHITLRQIVALKFLRPEIATEPEVLRRFVREAQAAAQIRSEHVARVMDAGTLDDGTVFLVFEHLTGRDLAQVLREDGPLPIPDAVDFLTQACEAIAEAHALGIVHRDLKPANLFLTRALDGAPFVKVLDFGLSKFNQSALTALTAENHVIGSPHFMSPEQMRSSRDADARSDIWALGVVLFGLLTGRVPFEGEFLTEVCAAILGGNPLSLLELRPETPAELEAVILRCLRSKPEERFQTVVELAEALQPFTPAYGRARAARIGRVVEGAKQSLATRAPSASAARTEVAPLAQLTRAKGSSSQPVVAERATGQGPSPVSWSISVEPALPQHSSSQPQLRGQGESPIASKLPSLSAAPPAVASSLHATAPSARLRRKSLLVTTGVVTLLLGMAGTFWVGRATPRRTWGVSDVQRIAASAQKSADLSGSVPALRMSSPASPAPPVPSASAEVPFPVLPIDRSKAARPVSAGVRTSVKRLGRLPAPGAPRPAASNRTARPSFDEELILSLPH